MKIPLRFQITEFDCGTVSLQNAISYLFERENIPAELVRAISVYTLDCYDEKGNLGCGGTSIEAINQMTKWITNYSKNSDFGLNCTHLENQDVTFTIIKECLDEKGCILLRSYQGCEHYVLITSYDSNYINMWDPYYLDETYYDDEEFVKIIFDQPFSHNRQVSIKRFNSENHKDFALGPIERRECVLFKRQ